MKGLALILPLVLGLASCEKNEPAKSESAPPAAPATAASPTDQSGATTPAAAAKAEESDGIPTEQDFEDEAEQKITAQNLDEELDKLEKEIAEGG